MTKKHPGIPVPQQTVDMATGEVTEKKTVRFGMMPAPPGTCEECAKEHDPAHPHNAQGMFYQYYFYGIHDRWPDWRDAMAHCTDEMKEVWTKGLEDAGVDVAGGKVHPSK